MKSAYASKIPEMPKSPEINPPEPNPVRDVPPRPAPERPDRR